MTTKKTKRHPGGMGRNGTDGVKKEKLWTRLKTISNRA